MTFTERLAKHAHDLDTDGHDIHLGPILYDFTTAQLATLGSSPVEIMPSLGSGTTIVPITAAWVYSGTYAFGTAPNVLGISSGISGSQAITFGSGTYMAISGTATMMGKHQNVLILENAGLYMTADLNPTISGSSNGVGHIAVWYGVMYRR